MIYPKEDILNEFGYLLYEKDKAYEAYKFSEKWIIKCDSIDCKDSIIDWKFIEDNFNFRKN